MYPTRTTPVSYRCRVGSSSWGARRVSIPHRPSPSSYPATLHATPMPGAPDLSSGAINPPIPTRDLRSAVSHPAIRVALPKEKSSGLPKGLQKLRYPQNRRLFYPATSGAIPVSTPPGLSRGAVAAALPIVGTPPCSFPAIEFSIPKQGTPGLSEGINSGPTSIALASPCFFPAVS